MQTVRLTTDRCGPTGFFPAGQTVEVPEAEALRLVETRQAEPIDLPAASGAEQRPIPPAPKRRRG